MRTTIDLKDEHRAKLLELAARRGEKGFSTIVGEAVELYLKTVASDEAHRQRALELRGVLDAKAAKRLRGEAANLRESWR